nr:MAG TPA: oxidoreductase [Bacteriophage sp.]
MLIFSWFTPFPTYVIMYAPFILFCLVLIV